MKSQQLSAGGTPIAIRVALALKEWAADSLILPSAAPVSLFSLLGITTGSKGSAGGSAGGFAPGVSALLSIPVATGAEGPNLAAQDVPAAVIVRSAAR
jgi:hypothetical protein